MSAPKSFFSHDADGENVTKDFWIAHFGHATEYNQLDEERRYHGFGGFVPSLQAPHNPKEQYKSNPPFKSHEEDRQMRAAAAAAPPLPVWETRDRVRTVADALASQVLPGSLHQDTRAPGQGDGRGELLIRGVVGAEGKAKLLATLKANPDAMLGAAPRGVKYDGSKADDAEDAITYDGSGIDANNAAQQRAQRQNRLHTGLGASRNH